MLRFNFFIKWFGFNFYVNGFGLPFLEWFGLNGLRVHKQFGLVFILYKWFSFKVKKERYITSFKRPKWPKRTNKRLHLKCCLVFENNKPRK